MGEGKSRQDYFRLNTLPEVLLKFVHYFDCGIPVLRYMSLQISRVTLNNGAHIFGGICDVIRYVTKVIKSRRAQYNRSLCFSFYCFTEVITLGKIICYSWVFLSIDFYTIFFQTLLYFYKSWKQVKSGLLCILRVCIFMTFVWLSSLLERPLWFDYRMLLLRLCSHKELIRTVPYSIFYCLYRMVLLCLIS